jgi:PAS domain S-box-containing protein
MGQVSDYVLILDEHLRILFSNRALDLPRELVEGQSILDWLPESDHPEVRQTAATCLTSGSTAHRRWSLCQQTRTYWFDVRLVPTSSEDKPIIWLFCRDITPEKVAEQQTRTSEDILGRILEMVPDAVTLTRLDDGRFIEINTEFERLSGHPRSDLLFKTSIDAGLWAEPKRRETIRRELKQNERIQCVEGEMIHRDGSSRYCMLSGQVIHLGNQDCLLTIIKDITERRRLENDLISSQEILSDIFENMQDVYYRFDVNDRLVLASRSALKMFRYETMDEIIGQPVGVFCQVPGFLEELTLAIEENGRINDLEVILSRGDETSFEASVSCQLLFSDNGTPEGMEGIIRDISGRKTAERLLEEHDQNLSSLFNTIEEFLLVIDHEGGIVHANAAVCEAYGLTLPQIRNKWISELCDPSYHEALGRYINEAEDSGERYHLIEFVNDSNEGIPLEIRFLRGKWSGQNVVFAIGRDIREWIDSQRALRDSEEKFGKAFRSGAAMMFITSLVDKRYIDVNDRFLDTIGYTRREVVGHSATELGLYQDENEQAQLLEELQTNRKICDRDIHIRTQSGQAVIGLFSAELVELNDQPCLLGVVIDVTARKAAEEALRLDEMRLETLLRLNQMTNASPREICDFSVDEGINLTGSQIGFIGFPDEKCKTMTILTSSPEAAKAIEPIVVPIQPSGMWGNAIIEGRPVIVNDYKPAKPLPEKHSHITRYLNVPIFENGRVVAQISVANKETEYDESDVRQLTLLMQGMWRILQHLKAEEEHQRLSAAIEQADEIILVTDTQYQIVFGNPSLTRITGYPLAEVLGKTFKMFQGFDDNSPVISEFLNCIRNGEAWSGQLSILRKDGSTYEQSTSVSPIRDQNGQVINYVVVGRDISHEVQLENQIRHVQKMEALGQLAGGIAHDFNNVLSAIIGSAEFAMLEINRKKDPNDLLREILKASDRASTLVRQLLTFSRKETLRIGTHNLNEIVTGVLKMIKRVIGEHIELEFTPSTGIGIVSVDAGQIENVLMNICINARDAMPGGGKILLETGHVQLDHTFEIAHEWAKAGEYSWITITDSGTGIPPEVLEHIFEPFFTTKAAGHGTGLGLATVYGIIRQHNGLVHVYSEVGKGTQFKIYLPIATPTTETIAENSNDTELVGGHETILLAEDEQMVREMVALVLRTAGYNVLEAINGEEALSLFQQQPNGVDLLLFDVIMPRINGKVAADRIHETRPDLPVIFSSGYSNQMLDCGLSAAERAGLVQKPYDIRQLVKRIRELLDKRA